MRPALLITTVLTAAQLVHAQAYITSCDRLSLGGIQGAELFASCLDEHGGKPRSRLNLNFCIANRDGALAAANNGNFAGSCSGFSITQNGIFSATCLKRNGGNQRSTITTNTFISNQNGLLACHGHYGVRA